MSHLRSPDPPEHWTAAVRIGTVKWFDRASGHGCVVPDGGGQDLYLHRVSLAGDLRLTLAAGDRLEFETRIGGTGPEAVNVVALASRRSAPQMLVASAPR